MSEEFASNFECTPEPTVSITQGRRNLLAKRAEEAEGIKSADALLLAQLLDDDGYHVGARYVRTLLKERDEARRDAACAHANANVTYARWSEMKDRAEAAEARERVLRDVFRNADERDWTWLYDRLADAGHGHFWRAVFSELRAALSPEPAAQCPECHGKSRHLGHGEYTVCQVCQDAALSQPAAPRESEALCNPFTLTDEPPVMSEKVDGARVVAWSYELATYYDKASGEYSVWREGLNRTKPEVPEGSIRNLTPLVDASIPRADEEQITCGARAIGRTMRWKNHMDRAREIWRAMQARDIGETPLASATEALAQGKGEGR